MNWNNNNNVLGFVAIVATLLVAETGAQVCSSYGFFCDSCTTVSICQSSIPTGVALSCPDGYYCDSTSSNVCTEGNCTSEPYAFYECESTGRHAWIYNCSEYIWCVNDSGTLSPTLQNCPSMTVYDPNTESCVLATSYDCVDATTASTTNETASTTDEATSASDETTSTTTDATFACTADGRFAITTDKTCESYYFCYLEPNGEWVQTLLTCPATTIFDPTSSACVSSSSYTCTN